MAYDDYKVMFTEAMFSIIPCLALRGVSDSIARSPKLQAKILLCELIELENHGTDVGTQVNSENDRETEGYTAVDYIQSEHFEPPEIT